MGRRVLEIGKHSCEHRELAVRDRDDAALHLRDVRLHTAVPQVRQPGIVSIAMLIDDAIAALPRQLH